MPYVGSVPLAVTDTVSVNVANTVTAGDLEVDSGTLSIDATNNRVGIGTTSPTGKLHIETDAGGVKLLTRGASSSTTTSNDADELLVDNAGNSGITIGSGTSNSGSIHFGDSGDNDIGKIVYNHNGNSLAFTTNTSEAMRIDSSGRVGIANTSPGSFNSQGQNLVIGSGSGDAGMTIYSGSGSGDSGNIFFADGTSGSDPVRGGVTYKHDTNQMMFRVNDANRLEIASDGKVGIGDAAPDTLLHINQGGEPPAEGMLILEANSASRQIRIQPPTDADNGFIDFRGGNLTFQDDGTEVARFQGTTGFGIGITNVTNKLDIATDSSNHIRLRSATTEAKGLSLIYDNTNDRSEIRSDQQGVNQKDLQYYALNHNFGRNASDINFKITDAGKVGIGTTSPGVLIDAAFTENTTSPPSNYGALGTVGMRITNDSVSNNQHGSALLLIANRLTTTDQAGQVSLACDVSANKTANMIFATRNGGNVEERMRLSADGKLGIGTTSPTTTLSVNGVITHIGGTASSTSDLTSGGLHFHDASTSAGDIMPITFTPSATADRARAGIGFISQAQDGSAGFAADIAFYTRGAADGSTLGTSDERMRINKDGRIGIGTATLDTNAQVQIEGAEEYFVIKHTAQMGIKLYGNDTNVIYSYDKDNNSFTGGITFNHADGTTIFNTGGSNERMRIASDGKISMGFAGTSGSVFHYIRTGANEEVVLLDATNASYGEDTLHIDNNRAATTSYNSMRITSGGDADSEFIIQGNGNVFADGSFSPGGADYAEYFEWKDGNSSSEDRRGYSVVLDSNKIVKATDSDDTSKIVGVISANPTVVGDSDIERWKQKHLTDDYGSYIYEDYTQTEWTIVEEGKDDIFHSYQTDLIPDGLTVPDNAIVTTKDEDGENLQRRKVNPDWNKDTAYISRADRKEWDTVGLMGKLRLRKGQPTGSNWIKMRDISDTVEEWLVR